MDDNNRGTLLMPLHYSSFCKFCQVANCTFNALIAKLTYVYRQENPLWKGLLLKTQKQQREK